MSTNLLALREYERTDNTEPADEDWRALGMFFVFRFVLSSLMLIFFFSGFGPSFLGSAYPELFALTSISYFGLVASSGLLLLRKTFSVDMQVQVAVFSDVLAITLLMHSSGGVESGLGMLLAISITSGSLLTEGRTALLFAASGSLALLVEQVYAHLHNSFATTAYSQAGMLGVLVFAMAILAHTLALKARKSEALARQRRADLANLAKLNEYVIQHAQTGILVVDREQRIRLTNQSALELLGTTDATIGQPLDQASPELAEKLNFWRSDPEQEPEPFRPVGTRNDVKAGFSRLDGRNQGTLISLQDYSALIHRVQRDKLASLGRLSASIAHEIRNPLGAISHASQLLSESPSLDRGDQRLTEIVRSNASRVNDIIENVLQLSRRNRFEPHLVSMSQCVNEFARNFRNNHSLDENTLSVHVDPEDTGVNVDPNQMHQVLTILCENALVHASSNRVPLRIALYGGVTLESEGPFLDVIDNGPGIPPDVAQHIFEPFFTTRAQGSGLGLYIARELSEANQIRLSYVPVPSGGSCFRLGFHETANFTADRP